MLTFVFLCLLERREIGSYLAGIYRYEHCVVKRADKRGKGHTKKRKIVIFYLDPIKPGIQELRLSRFSVGEVGEFSPFSTTAPPPRRGLATRPKFNAMEV